MLSKIYEGFSNLKDVDLYQLGSDVVEQMTENAKLYNPTLLAEKDKLVPMCQTFQILIDKAGTRAKIAVHEKNDYRKLFLRQLKLIATMINFEYRGDTIALEGCGFKVMLTPKKHKLTPISNLVITQSEHEGYVKVRVVGAQNYKSILVYISQEQNANINEWKQNTMTRKTFELGKYEFGTQIFIQVEAFGIDQTSVKSKIYTVAVS